MRRLALPALALSMLALPWAGCRHARELGAALRAEERAALATTADALAASLSGRTDLLYRDAARSTSQGWAPAGAGDLRPVLLASAPQLDGYGEDWPAAPGAWLTVRHDAQRALRLLTGVHEHTLYALLVVEDAHPVYDAAGGDALEPANFGDRIWLGLVDDTGTESRVFLAASGPGALAARRVEAGDYGERHAVPEPRLKAAWQPAAAGYRVEIAVPLAMAGGGFGVLVDDRDERGGPAVSYGTLAAADLAVRGRLITASPELGSWLAQHAPPGVQLTVSAPDGRALARLTGAAPAPGIAAGPPFPLRLLHRLLDSAAGPAPSAVAPIPDEAHRRVIGLLQASGHVAGPKRRALAGRLAGTLGATALAMLLCAVALALAIRRRRVLT